MALDNTIVQGIETIELENNQVYPVDGDAELIGEIVAYSEALAKVTLESPWDLKTPKEQFFAWAKYEGVAGTPTAAEVTTGANIPFHRVGRGNIDFASIPTDYQLYDDTSTTKASFVAFFPKTV